MRRSWPFFAIGLGLVACSRTTPPEPEVTAGPKLSGWGAELLEDPAPFADLVRGDPGWRALLSGQPSKAKAAPGSPLERRIRSERAAVLEQLGRLVAEAQGRYLRRRAELTDGLSEPAQALLRRSEAFETAAGPSGVKLEGPAGWLAAGAPGEPPCAVKDPELSLCGVEGPAVTEPVMTPARSGAEAVEQVGVLDHLVRLQYSASTVRAHPRSPVVPAAPPAAGSPPPLE